ncbi:PAP2 superfamily protein [Xylophilus ampelinus]|nr:phosphatase PAP2 family protein [Variovorax sp.]VTY39855.1 PAP2 superfamily protein [Xylophilus ampelinus]
MNLKLLAYDWLGLNQRLFEGINAAMPASLEGLVRVGSALGNYWGAPLVVAALLLWGRSCADVEYGARIIDRAILFGWAFLSAFAIASALKWGLDLPRPGTVLGQAAHVLAQEEPTHGFPSGHSVYAMLVATAMWPIVSAPGRVMLLLGLLGVGYSRIALGAHFPADVVGGWMVGLACFVAANDLTQRIPMVRSASHALALRLSGRSRLRATK